MQDAFSKRRVFPTPPSIKALYWFVVLLLLVWCGCGREQALYWFFVLYRLVWCGCERAQRGDEQSSWLPFCLPCYDSFRIPLKMATETSVAKTILYLRPQAAAVEVLDIFANEPYVFKVAPPPEPVDIPIGEIPDIPSTTYLSPCNALHDHGRGSRGSTPGLYPISQTVLRLGFDSVKKPSARGFEFGSLPNSDVKVPYYSTRRVKTYVYFRIHYNFSSGALLITALDEIKVGSARLDKQQSLLLMAGTSIHCGGEFEFIVEFPDTRSCADEYERNYHKHAAKVGFPDAPYLISSREELPPIGAEHRSKAILGKGAFGEVHKALNIKDGRALAIKVLSGGGECEMKEVNIMSRLCHVS